MDSYIIERDTFMGGTEIVIAKRHAPNQCAELAMRLADHLAIVAAEPDGEDSAGRQKLRMLAPDDCAARACDIASAMWLQFEMRGWLQELPEPKPQKFDRKSKDTP